GGFFRNFYQKYPRLNYMQKRMLYLSRRINAEANPDKNKKIFARLYKAQTNCGYWHGVFGGFYLGHIRSAVYENLIEAENMLDEATPQKISVEAADIDFDGNEEIMLKNNKLICCFSKKGASLCEMSLRKPAINLLNTITRKEESYHKKILQNVTKEGAVSTIHDIVKQKESGLDKYLVYDQYERLSLMDHLLKQDITLEDFNYQRGISTLSDELYTIDVKKGKQAVSLDCEFSNGGLDFFKVIEFSDACGFKVNYKFSGKNILKDYDFGIEFNISLLSPGDIFAKSGKEEIALSEPKEFKERSSFIIIDKFKKLTLEFAFDKAHILSMPVYSVSSSESGFEKVYQQTVVLFVFKRKDAIKFSLDIKHSRD
ncbi:MAG: DUF1926 domain-containing protein, partial [Candidatus Omnitrophica bacterium]|nr:DUF1926 domain-containing protein [Candidatus Omnitrophota bacterium]